MSPYLVKTAFTALLALTMLIQGCGDSDSTKTKDVQSNDPRLIGTWRQTAIGKKKVSGIIVKLTFKGRALTMEAPGCLIIGDYTTADDVFIYTVTSVQGERCADTQKIGKSDSVRYRATESQLFLTPASGGEESQTEYERMKDDQHP